jgi:putative flavoprotein involved in K+ transport
MSYLLTEQGKSHVILEQARIAESWRSKRWDSLRLIAPNWSLRLPGYVYHGDDPDGFMSKDEVVAHLETYARSFGAPVREGIHVAAIERTEASNGFLVRTEGSEYHADQVVIAAGALQQPRLPPCAQDLPAQVAQVPAPTYRNPAVLPPGAVLIVGSGETGCQIAEELCRAGRTVYLCCGRSWWVPRRYRGRDLTAWFRVVGWFDRTVDDLPPGVRTGQTNPQLTGSDGGHDISAHTLARAGVILLGRLQGVRDAQIALAPDLAQNLAWGDEQGLAFLRIIDEYIAEQHLEVPEEAWPADLCSADDLARYSPTQLDLRSAGITTLIWATGYRPDLGWVRLPILDREGYPNQRRGVTAVPGLYILGLDWLHTAKSGLFAGISEDAAYLAERIAEWQDVPL